MFSAVEQFGSLDIAVCSAAISGDHNDIANETMDFVDDCMVRTILKKQERRAQKQ